MQPEDLQRDFNVRYYHWALQDFRREIQHDFPFLRGFKTGSAFEIVEMMSKMSSREKLLLASALVKRFHKDGVQAAGDRIAGA